jgi:hypothetical protein
VTRPTLPLAAALLCASCHAKPTSLAATSASAVPVDHLAPNELAAGTAEAWGFPIPREMHIEYRYKEVVHLVGRVKPDALANYVRDRIVVSHVEIGAARTIFPNAHIKGGPADKVFQLEVTPEPGFSRLTITDVTPPPIEPGLTDEERWRKAGLTPQGQPLDIEKFE